MLIYFLKGELPWSASIQAITSECFFSKDKDFSADSKIINISKEITS